MFCSFDCKLLGSGSLSFLQSSTVKTEMQAKIIDFASDKIAKSLQKIDKEDVMNAYSKVSSRIRRNKYLLKKDQNTGTKSDENNEMLEKVEIDTKAEKSKKLIEAEAILVIENDDGLNTDGKSYPLKIDNLCNVLNLQMKYVKTVKYHLKTVKTKTRHVLQFQTTSSQVKCRTSFKRKTWLRG